jgi:hypothetical protein
VRVIVEQLVEWRLAVETEVLGENLPQRHFVHHKSHLTKPGIEPRPRWKASNYPLELWRGLLSLYSKQSGQWTSREMWLVWKWRSTLCFFGTATQLSHSKYTHLWPNFRYCTITTYILMLIFSGRTKAGSQRIISDTFQVAPGRLVLLCTWEAPD